VLPLRVSVSSWLGYS